MTEYKLNLQRSKAVYIRGQHFALQTWVESSFEKGALIYARKVCNKSCICAYVPGSEHLIDATETKLKIKHKERC